MQITKELVEYVANLSRIKLDDKQAEKMQLELASVIEYMEVLNKLETDDIEPLSHVFNITNVMREDIVKESFDRDELLKNAPEHTDETFVVPKTVD
ncbi:MAG: Asp-tRNA(Asn)/Glu-tRNA(Gln) amidotransferase subunit GatC [Clostridia bacterium]|nr:Asp-tRNA(Asn)/Glu-tRNA(Gln) amidotransferase subunit GatC [Clostridia bacterium]